MTLRQRQPREKDAKHLDFIRSLPCACCGNDIQTEAAHLRSGNLKYGKPPTGGGEKPSDKWALPLCGQCHRRQHEGDEEAFWAFGGINPWVLAMTLHNLSGDHAMACTAIERQRSKFFAMALT